MKKRLLSVATIAITLILLILVISTVGLDELVSVLQNANPLYVGLAFVWAQIVNLPGIFKVQGLLWAQGYNVPFWYLFKLYHVGVFFNHFLPSNVGGDVIRAYEIGKVTNDKATSLAAVFVERLTGFFVLVTFAVIALMTHLWVVTNVLLLLAVLSVIAGLITVTWLVLDTRLMHLFERITPKPLQKYLAKFQKFQNALHTYGNHRHALRMALIWSLLFNLGAIVYSWLAAQAFHSPINLIDMAFVIPLTMVVAIIPLSFNGIGLQEWAFVLLFPLVGIPATVGLSAIITIRLITLVTALLGGLFYLQMNIKRDAKTALAQS